MSLTGGAHKSGEMRAPLIVFLCLWKRGGGSRQALDSAIGFDGCIARYNGIPFYTEQSYLSKWGTEN